jgi:hypothetical protein
MAPFRSRLRFKFSLRWLFIVVTIAGVVAGIAVHWRKIDFWLYTGLWPSNARVIACRDTHGGFHGDGEFSLVLEVDRATMERWLKRPPPWGISWMQGPIPRRGQFSGIANAEDVQKSRETWFAVRDRDPRWNWAHYDTLIIDPRTNQAWLSIVDL